MTAPTSSGVRDLVRLAALAVPLLGLLWATAMLVSLGAAAVLGAKGAGMVELAAAVCVVLRVLVASFMRRAAGLWLLGFLALAVAGAAAAVGVVNQARLAPPVAMGLVCAWAFVVQPLMEIAAIDAWHRRAAA